MRPFAFALFALCNVVPAAQAAQPAAAPAPKIPHMSHQEALAYVDREQLAIEPSNLVSPIMNGKAELVEALLSAGVDPNDMKDMPKPALRLAASACANKGLDSANTLTIIEILLAHGAKVNEPSPAELSPLMVAAQQCPAAVVRRLLKAGADTKFKTSLGISPLSMAFIVGNLDAAEALIEGGARLSPEAAGKLLKDHKDDARRTALINKARGK